MIKKQSPKYNFTTKIKSFVFFSTFCVLNDGFNPYVCNFLISARSFKAPYVFRLTLGQVIAFPTVGLKETSCVVLATWV